MTDFDHDLRAALKLAAPAKAPPLGAKARVLEGVRAGVESGRRWRTTRGYFFAAAAAALLVAVMAWFRRGGDLARTFPVAPPASSAPTLGAGAIQLGARARLVVRPGTQVALVRDEPAHTTLRLDSGQILVHVDKNKEARVFDVIAGATRVEVVGTTFAVRREGAVASVRVLEGVVRVEQHDRVDELRAGTMWPEGAPPIAVSPDDESSLRGAPAPHASSAPPVTPTPPASSAAALPKPRALARPPGEDAYRRAKDRERAGDAAGALAAYEALSSGTGDVAEASLFAAGRIRASSGAHAEALSAFQRYRARFPNGRFARDVDVYVLDIHMAQRAYDAARAECDRFLAAFPGDPRAPRFAAARDAIAKLRVPYNATQLR
jgi:TolA-binding protein